MKGFRQFFNSIIAIVICISMLPVASFAEIVNYERDSMEGQTLDELREDMDYIKEGILNELYKGTSTPTDKDSSYIVTDGDDDKDYIIKDEEINDDYIIKDEEINDDYIIKDEDFETEDIFKEDNLSDDLYGSSLDVDVDVDIETFIMEAGRSYEITNISETINHSIKNSTNYNNSKRYDYSTIRKNGNTTYNSNSYGNMKFEAGSDTTITILGDESVELFIPIEIYNIDIMVKESEEPALTYVTMEPGRNYELRNLSETSNHTIKNDTSYSNDKRYDHLLTRKNGHYSYGEKDYGSISLAGEAKIDLSLYGEESTRFYMPTIIYERDIRLEEKEDPVLTYFTMESGKNYQLRNLSETEYHTIKNDTSYSNDKRYDHLLTRKNGHYSYGEKDYGSISLSGEAKIDLSLYGEEATRFYMPTMFYERDIRLEEKEDPVLTYFTMESGKNYQLRNLSETEYHTIKNDTSYSDDKRYDYLLTDRNGSYSYRTKDYGNINLNKEAKIDLSLYGEESTRFYMPTIFYERDIGLEEKEDPVLTYFTMEKDKHYTIRNLSNTNRYSIGSDSNNQKRYSFSQIKENGSYVYKEADWGSLVIQPNTKTNINPIDDLEILLFMPYAWYGNVITIEEGEEALHKFALEPGRNYEIVNNTNNNIGIMNNSSRKDERTYDYIRYRNNSRILDGTDFSGSIQVDSNNKTLISVAGSNPIECYIPKELYLSGIEYNEIDRDIGSIYDFVPRVNVEIKKTLAKMEGDNSSYEVEDSLDKYYINVYNESKNKRIYGIEVRGNTILLMDEDTSIGDNIRIELRNKLEQTNEVEGSITIEEDLSSKLDINVVEKGYFRASYDELEDDGRVVSSMIFDENGLFKSYFDANTEDMIISKPLNQGIYKIVILKQSGYMWRLNNIEEYETLGFVEGIDYVVKTIEIKDGEIIDLGNIIVPSFDEEKLSYFDKSGTYLTTNMDKVLVGGLLEFRMEYKFKERYRDSNLKNIKLQIELPKGASLVDNSVILNGKSVPYTEKRELLTVDAEDYEGVLRFYIKPFESSKFETKGKVRFTYNRSIEEVIGQASFDVPYLTIEGNPNTSLKDIVVKGVSNKGGEISIYDEDKIIGTTKADNHGKWSAKVGLDGAYDGSIHNIYATTIDDSSVEQASNNLEVKYGQYSPEIKEFIMYHRNQKVDILSGYNNNIRNHCTFYPNKVFSFYLEIENAETIKDVYITSTRNNEEKRIKATYDEKTGRYIASGLFDPNNKNYVPGTISVDYSKKESDLVLDTDKVMTPEELKETLPSEWADADVTIKDNSADNIVASIRLNDDSKPFDVNIKTTHNANEWTASEYESNGYSRMSTSDNSDIFGRMEINKNDSSEEKSLVVMTMVNMSENTIVTVTTDFFDSTYGSLAYGGYSIIKDVISYGGRTIDIDSTRNKIINSNIPSWEKEELLGELDHLFDVARGGLIISISLTAIGAIPLGLALPTVLLIGTTNILIGVGIDQYFKWKMEQLNNLMPGVLFAWRIDPSGYVYEIIPTNRLEGVTVRAYTQDETGQAVLWDSLEYDQVNPLVTNWEGRYAWDVPEGQWQVEAEFAGYETALSEWLPVPPPQTEVNISMVSLREPGIEEVNIYEDYGVIDFDKYMPIDNIVGSSIEVLDKDGLNLNKTLEPVDIIESPEGVKLSKRFIVNWDEDVLIIQDNPYTITISKGLECYNNIKIEKDIVISKRARVEAKDLVYDEISSMKYGEVLKIPIKVNPANATNGLELICTSNIIDIATIVNISEFDNNGIAYIEVIGNLPGRAELDFEVKGTDLSGKIELDININDFNTPQKEYINWPKESRTDQNHSWTIDFSQDIDESTVSSENVYIIDENGLKQGYIQPRIKGKSIILTNNGRFDIGGKYYIIIEAEIKSKSGDKLEKGIKMEFEIE